MVWQLNAQVPAHLAGLSKKLGATLVYISTGKCIPPAGAELSDELSVDYVFDGTSPPYTPSAKTNPLQLYGLTKRDGEEAVLSVDGAKVIVLRVPVLSAISHSSNLVPTS